MRWATLAAVLVAAAAAADVVSPDEVRCGEPGGVCADWDGWEGRCVKGKVSVKNSSGTDWETVDGLRCDLLSPKQKLAYLARLDPAQLDTKAWVVIAVALALFARIVYELKTKKPPNRGSTSAPPDRPPPDSKP